MTTLYVRQPYLSWIQAGKKTFEVRVADAHVLFLKIGGCITLRDGQGEDAMVVEAEVVKIREFCSFFCMLQSLTPEELNFVAPDFRWDEILCALIDIYPPHREALGVRLIELRVIPKAAS